MSAINSGTLISDKLTFTMNAAKAVLYNTNVKRKIQILHKCDKKMQNLPQNTPKVRTL